MFELMTPQKKFDCAFSIVIDHEGGYSNDPDDPGGKTNFGITQEDWDQYSAKLKLSKRSVIDLTLEDAKSFYKQLWDEYNFTNIDGELISSKIFDMGVNIGFEQAFKLVQKVINDMGHKLVIDGIMGMKTKYWINDLIFRGQSLLLKQNISHELKAYYEHLVINNPSLEKFLPGWLKRAAD